MLELIARLIIDLSEQRLYAYGPSQVLLYSALVSTGLPASPTPVGAFHIQAKYASTDLTGATYQVKSVPHVMCLGGPGLGPDRYCIHPAPWQEQGGQCFGVPRSHGCIRTTVATARWLFERTAVGTPVEIRP
ncbi:MULTISPECIES: L,D-transpeptidase [Aphanothece]|uniref:L,D-transpeptidase n=1 Tax=Aphanothece TaxID=1121 RepID=UPI0039846485